MEKVETGKRESEKRKRDVVEDDPSDAENAGSSDCPVYYWKRKWRTVMESVLSSVIVMIIIVGTVIAIKVKK